MPTGNGTPGPANGDAQKENCIKLNMVGQQERPERANIALQPPENNGPKARPETRPVTHLAPQYFSSETAPQWPTCLGVLLRHSQSYASIAIELEKGVRAIEHSEDRATSR